VITTGITDNGEGSARSRIHVHRKEFIEGSTITPNYHVLGFDATGAITNQVQFGSTWDNIVDKSIKILSFMDVGGDKKFSSTQIRTLMTNIPDYAMLFINPVDKMTEVSKEHFRMAKSLQVPMIVILTHSDMVTPDQHREALSQVSASDLD
jgi:GTPase